MKNNFLTKAFIFGIIFLLLGTGLVSGFNETNYSTESDSKVNNNKKTNYVLAEEYPTMAPIPIDLPGRESKYFSVNLIDTPDEFSWRNIDGKDWTSPAQNQGNCGSCWLFAGMGTLESVINIREGNADLDPDLSEQYVLSCLPGAGSCNGGNVDNCVFYYIQSTSSEGNYKNGVITEGTFNYQSNFNYIPPCSDKDENWDEFLVPILDYEESWTYYNIPELKDTIKSLIFQKSPVMTYFWASERFINWGTFNKLPSQYYRDFNEDCPNFVNHAITIVGWKDDPSINNGGYWICKNTWGSNWGYDGFFNIEYDCLNLGAFIAWVDYDPESFDWAPIAPTINGPSNGEPEVEYEYEFNSVDPDGEDDIYYYIDWGDGNVEEWIGPSNSGEKINVKHTWENKDNYNIRAKAKDVNGRESNWGTIEFSMPRNKQLFNSPFLNSFIKILDYLPFIKQLIKIC